MTVTDVLVTHYRVPRNVWWPEGSIGASQYEISHFELVICEVNTSEGARGVGFTYTVGQGGSAVLALLRDEIAPLLLGRELHDVEVIWRELHEKLHFVGAAGVTAMAIAAADTALWDALACAAGLPLYRYLGAHRSEIPAYASAVNLALPIDTLAQQMADYRNQGFSAVKMKVGRSLREDVDRVRAVRAAIGDECELFVDANMAWDLTEAVRRLRAFAPYEIAWLEEPLPPHDIRGYALLQQSAEVPLAAGETLFTPHEFSAYFRVGAIRIPQPDVIRLGVTGWRQVARSTLEWSLPLAPHFIPEIHVHLACTVPNALNLEYLPLFERLLETPIEIRAGIARPIDAPGHGLRFRYEILKPYLVEAKEAALQ